MRAKRKRKIDPIPKDFGSIEAAAEFWDTHDLTDYLQYTRPVKNLKFDIKRRCFLIALDSSLGLKLHEEAKKRGVSSEALANRWLRDKLKTVKS